MVWLAVDANDMPGRSKSIAHTYSFRDIELCCSPANQRPFLKVGIILMGLAKYFGHRIGCL
ncbi:MAG: hypothetical protein H8D67_00990 [Deltaproteobacteria bacterium]|nr:hypothetical protein [Deltaproteobacteria bacterium]